VGTYTLSAVLKNKSFDFAEPITVLFNPWCEQDDVFMPDAALREEYINNENGAIWVLFSLSIPSFFYQFTFPPKFLQKSFSFCF
jgi:hypothetical protein